MCRDGSGGRRDNIVVVVVVVVVTLGVSACVEMGMTVVEMNRCVTAGSSEVPTLGVSSVTRRTSVEAMADGSTTTPAMKVEVTDRAAGHHRGGKTRRETEVS